MHLNYYLLVIWISIIIPKGTSLMCYECTTFLEDECGEDFDPADIEKTECEGETDVCIIHMTPPILRVPEAIQRSCAEADYCSELDEFSEHCIICDEDLCNSSSSLIASFATSLGYLVIILLK